MITRTAEPLDLINGWQAEKVQWLQQVGVKRPQRGLARLFGRRRLNERCIVAMVGDGINDAPVSLTPTGSSHIHWLTLTR